MNAEPFVYAGKELDVFANAKNWKRYWASAIRPWIKGDVLEVGAGLGANTAALMNGGVRTWHCIEPDPELAKTLAQQVSLIPGCSVSVGTIAEHARKRYDTILYIDVLEHIEGDREELAAAAQMLRPGGHLIVLSPAYQFLYSAFDASIGHYRRYDKTSLSNCAPPGCSCVTTFYLDVAGTLASLANRMLLSQSTPTQRQIQFWDRYLIPLSKALDPCLGRRAGRSILAVWART